MAEEDKDFDESEGEYTDFVPAVFARSVDEAEKYRELLDDHDIPAIIGTADHDENADEDEDEDAPRRHSSRGLTRGVPVLVPEALLDEAGEIIAETEESDEFSLDDDYDSDEEDELDIEDELNEALDEDDLSDDDLFDDEK